MSNVVVVGSQDTVRTKEHTDPHAISTPRFNLEAPQDVIRALPGRLPLSCPDTMNVTHEDFTGHTIKARGESKSGKL